MTPLPGRFPLCGFLYSMGPFSVRERALRFGRGGGLPVRRRSGMSRMPDRAEPPQIIHIRVNVVPEQPG